jgi:hypothetical protein
MAEDCERGSFSPQPKNLVAEQQFSAVCGARWPAEAVAETNRSRPRADRPDTGYQPMLLCDRSMSRDKIVWPEGPQSEGSQKSLSSHSSARGMEANIIKLARLAEKNGLLFHELNEFF